MTRERVIAARAAALVALFLVGTLAALPQVAGAQPPEQTPEALIDRAIDLRTRGDDVAAHDLLARAFAQSPTPRATAQLGLVEQALGRWVEAERHIAQALAHREDEWISRNRAALEGSLATVRDHLGSLDVLCDVDGARLVVRGETLGRTPLAEPIRLPAGRVDVEVVADGHAPEVFSIEVRPGELSRQTVELQPLVVPPPESVSPPESEMELGVAADPEVEAPARRRRWWPWALAAVVAVGAATAIGFAASGGRQPPIPGTDGVVVVALEAP